MAVYSETDLLRFLEKVDRSAGDDACWPWLGYRRDHHYGHGTILMNRKIKQAHRVAYELAFGEIKPGLVVRHKCDFGPCCNPAHLELGTPADNNRDTKRRGRHRAKLHGLDVRAPLRLLPVRTEEWTAWRKRSPTLEEKYWKSVVVCGGEDCWGWEGVKQPNGYGVLARQEKKVTEKWYAHRFSWTLHNGPIPKGMFVCHRCDNPECSRPDHLFLGTNADNMADMFSKGRAPLGEKHGTHTHPEMYRGEEHWTHKRPELIRRGEEAGGAILSQLQAQEILDTVTCTADAAEFAKRFGVSVMAVSDVWARRTWKHLKGQRKMKARLSAAERFWPKVDASNGEGCWPWLGAKSSNGAGAFWHENRDMTARRVAYLLSLGDVPKGFGVTSTCGRVDCCRPDHLKLARPSPPHAPRRAS